MIESQMDVVVCSKPGELIAERRSLPECKPGELLVRVRRVGVCGTDLHIFRGTQPFLSYPRVMGHEIAGELATPTGDGRLREGAAVYVIPYLSCGRCGACRKQKPNCCARLEVLGVHRDGAFSTFIAIPEEAVYSAEGLSLDDAAMIEFLAIGAHAVGRGDVRGGQRVLVNGAGPIGMACALFARLRGAETTVLDPRADRRAACTDRLNVAHAWAPGASTRQQLMELTMGDMFDVVFDATGNRDAMQTAFDYIAHGGVYVLVSIVNGEIAFSDPEFHKREATLLASRNATAGDFEFVRDCIRAGMIPTDALRTHGAELLEIPAILPVWSKPEAGVIKAVVRC